jgi:peroxiredoxin
MLTAAVLLAFLAPAQGSPSGAVDQYRSLEREYRESLEEHRKAVAAAKTPEERQKLALAQQVFFKKLVGRFVALAESSPRSEAAIDSLIWVAQNSPQGLEGEPRSAALRKLSTDSIESEKLGRLCTQFVRALDPDSEKFLRLTLAKSPHTGVQARACVSLALNLKHRARVLQAVEADRELARQYEAVWGKAVMATLRERKVDETLAECEKFLARVREKYGEVAHPTFGNLGRLEAILTRCVKAPVTVGKLAPQIQGQDLQGKPLKLSDYRGKVVLLDFWGSAFAPSREAFSREQALVKRLAGRPFVLLGVSADGDRVAARKLAETEGLSWPSWWDAGTAGGPIATRWEVEVWPTLFLIDHKGILRHLNAGWPSEKELGEAVDALVREAETAGKSP